MRREHNLRIDGGTLVRVYRNLHQKCWSVQIKVMGRWLVVRHEHEQVHIKHAVFKVSESGRQKVVREKKKNVHAFVVGKWGGHSFRAMEDQALDFRAFKRISYNPYKAPTFVDHDGLGVAQADDLWLTPKGVFAQGVTYVGAQAGQAVVGGVQQDSTHAGVVPHAS